MVFALFHALGFFFFRGLVREPVENEMMSAVRLKISRANSAKLHFFVPFQANLSVSNRMTQK